MGWMTSFSLSSRSWARGWHERADSRTTEMVNSGIRAPRQYPRMPSSRNTSAAMLGILGTPRLACIRLLRLSS